MFRRLRTKLTVLYAGLFGASLILVSVAVYAAVASNAERAVHRELEASSTVFDRIWTLRSQQLEDGAGILSRDFGFRAAIATRDEPTIRSALSNLRVRLGTSLAFIVGLDGRAISDNGPTISTAASTALTSLDGDQSASGVIAIGDVPYEAISTPIMSPTLMGWVVFANRLDDKELASIERLSAIPLKATVLHRDRTGQWRSESGAGSARDRAALSQFVEHELAARNAGSRELMTATGRAVALVKPLKSLSAGTPAALLLRYPVSSALAPYRFLLETFALTGVFGFVLLLVGSWALARSVTRPISALDEAARRLQNGENVSVATTSNDEIGRLADSFNTMASEIRERERRITHLAMHDPETDLPNRLALERDIEPLLARANGRRLVVAALGVDRFTHLRGAIGYGLAGALMREIAAKLRWMHPEHLLARVSTEVLAVAFLVEDLDAARRLAAEILAALEAPLRLGDNTVDVSLTIGLAMQDHDAPLSLSLVERANIALDQARAARRKVGAFDPELYGDPSSNLSLMSDMLNGIAEGQLVLHHQPKLDLRSGKVTAVEALVRWRHPERGLMAPDLFIPMAEETGHIGALTEWVLGRAIEEQALLSHHGQDVAMSVNLSGRLLGDEEFAGLALDMARGARGELCFEITETAVIENPEVALKMIDTFAANGIGISIDDYGTGLSSLAYLKQIRADELKIDKAFVFKVGESQKDALLVRSTIDLAHSLGLKVTAEGVETAVALTLLTGMSCDLAQGYFIARPMPLKELLTFLAQDRDTARERRHG